MADRPLARLQRLDIELPRPRSAGGSYRPAVFSGNHVHIAGQICAWEQEIRHRGQVGAEISPEEGREAARLCALNILAQLQAALGTLDRVRRCVKLNVFVRCTSAFTDLPEIADGASDLLLEVFGPEGQHARSTIGVAQLPRGACVEADAIFEIAPAAPQQASAGAEAPADASSR